MAGMNYGMGGSVGGTTANAVGGNPMQNLNQFMLQNLMNLIAANPSFLTAGIPNKLLTQWMEPQKPMPAAGYAVCFPLLYN